MNIPQLRFPEFEGEWEKKKLGEIADVKTGPFGSSLHQHDYVEIGTPIITVEHLNELGIVHKNLPMVSDSDKTRLKSYHLKTGDLVFSRVGSVDRCSLISEKENGWLFSGRLLRVRFHNQVAAFFNYQFQLETTKQKVRNIAVGQTMPSINTEILKSIELDLTNLPEQTKIASFLTAIDEKIQTLKKKKRLIEDYKKGIMQKLFSQELRFKDEIGNDFPEWEVKKLGEVLSIPERIKPEKIDKNKLLTVKLHLKGLFKNESTDGLSIGSTNYFVRKKGQFIYGKQNLFNGAFGIVSEEFDGFLTSGDIPALDIDYLKLNSIFLLNFLGREFFYKKLEDIASGSGSKRIHENGFLNVEITLPSLPEQTLIANFLSALDDKIKHTTTQIEQTETWKKGLLQKMFV